MFLIDGHLDLADNALNWYRDLDLSIQELREKEAGIEGKGRARNTVTLPEMRRGEVGLSLAVVVDRIGKVAPHAPEGLGTPSLDVSYAKGRGQLAYYQILRDEGKIRIITDSAGLDSHVQGWMADPGSQPLGMVLNMEGADPITWPEQINSWHQEGVRIVAMAYNKPNLYADGTGGSKGLTDKGRVLLRLMNELKIILDLTHLSEPSFWEALEAFPGTVLASHNNCRALVPGVRQFSDEQLRAIIARDGVIGVALDAWMLYPGYVRGETARDTVSLDSVVDHICHICDVAGNTNHAAVGTDLDGGYGTEQCPRDLDTIADLQKVPAILRRRGFGEEDVIRVMRGNWLRLLHRAWA